jgi:hypothetical protein
MSDAPMLPSSRIPLTMSGAYALSRGGRVVADIPQGDCEAEPQSPAPGYRLFWFLPSGRLTSVRLFLDEYDALRDSKMLLARA